MRCSCCERALERYVARSLPAREMRAVAGHVRDCERCGAVLAELKVVEALLATARPPQLEPNFTFAVMAEVRTLPPPRAPQRSLWGLLAVYLCAAWVALGAALVLTRTSPQTLLAGLAGAAGHANAVAGQVVASLAHALGDSLPLLLGFGIGVLLVDLAAALAVALLYVVVRPRLAARLTSSSEGS